MTYIDITRPLHPDIAVWPGDTPVSLQHVMRLAAGDSVNLSSITMSLHAGTHVDAPLHFDANGESSTDFANSYCTEIFCGAARVIHLPNLNGRQITIEDLETASGYPAARLLIRTDVWPLDAPFPDSIPVIAPDVPLYLKSCGVLLLGLDLPSVDALDSKTLENHHALHAAGITILESLSLSRADGGLYEMIALPLPIIGADAAPVRAVLQELI